MPKSKAIDYRKLIPPSWQGRCVFCRRRLDVDDFRRQKVVASVIPEGIDAMCCCHVTNSRTYDRAVKALATAVARRLGHEPEDD